MATDTGTSAGLPSVATWLGQATQTLADIDSPRLDAELLLADALDKSRTSLYAWPDATIPLARLDALQHRLTRRAAGEPLAYILGEREFWSLPLSVTPAVLVPRPETECLVEHALQSLDKGATGPIVEPGTGSGAIAIALAHELRAHASDVPIIATDNSVAALAVAQHNTRRHVADRIDFVCADWLSAFACHSAGMIISNPPYLAADDPHLDGMELQYEPRRALVSGSHGLDALAQLIGEAVRVGRPGCHVILEHGYHQGDAVRELMLQRGFTTVRTFPDLAALDRFTSGYCPGRQ